MGDRKLAGMIPVVTGAATWPSKSSRDPCRVQGQGNRPFRNPRTTPSERAGLGHRWTEVSFGARANGSFSTFAFIRIIWWTLKATSSHPRPSDLIRFRWGLSLFIFLWNELLCKYKSTRVQKML
jgi:hypothetical protein